MKNKQFFILILLLVIGFASISATLVINGNTKVAANLDDFNVIFIEGFLNGEPNESVVISGDKKTLTFRTNKLTSINDTTRIDYKVKNISTQYDGDVTINCTNEANDYVNITSSFDGHNLPLANSINMQAQEVKSGYINAELIKATTEDQEVKVTCKIEVNATSRTNYAYSLSFDSNGGTNVEDKVVEYNTSYGALSTPTKEGYTFIGWFNEEDIMVDETTILDTKGNKKLTAKWAEKAYPVEIKKIYSDKTETTEVNVPYGESLNTLITIDDKYYIDNIECTNGYTVDNFNRAVYENATIKINNNNNPKTSTCTLTMLQGIYDFSYTGSEQLFEVPYDGNYKIELWGARAYGNGNGAYTSGDINLLKEEDLFLYIGGTPSSLRLGGYNGGGAGGKATKNEDGYGGGGATDVRLKNGVWNNSTSLRSRIMVAAGGGASDKSHAGGLTGYKSVSNISGASIGNGGTQISGGAAPAVYSGCGDTPTTGTKGNFGYGGVGGVGSYGGAAGGGGGGYYGGSGGGGGCQGGWSGGGGSSFISGHAGCIAIKSETDQTPKVTTYSKIEDSYHYSEKIFINTEMIDGAGYNWTTTKGEQTGMPTHDGKSTMTGNTGNGYAKITYLGK